MHRFPQAWFDEPKYNRTLSAVGFLLCCLLYVVASVLPFLMLAFAGGVALGLFSGRVLLVMAGLAALDFLVPIENGFKPNLAKAQRIFRFVGEGGAAYFGAKSICKAKLSKDKAYILAAWPHGLLGGGGHFCFVDLHLQGFHTICTGASIIQYIPFLRRFMNMCGSADVSKRSLTKLLQPRSHPYSVAHLVVGGIAEMFYGSGEIEQIVLAKRKGFVKLAMQTGAAIIPSYTFGTNQMFYRPCGPKSYLARLSSVLQVSVTPWCGRWYVPFSPVPFRVPVLSVLGEVFEVPHNPEPTHDEVEQQHVRFCAAMRALFDAHKKDYVALGADKAWLEKTLKLENE